MNGHTHCACCPVRQERERKIREMVASGQTINRVAKTLGISGEIVRRHAAAVGVMPRRKVVSRVVSEEKPMRAGVAVKVCVCGCLQAVHHNGKGACAATGCPAYFERGA